MLIVVRFGANVEISLPPWSMSVERDKSQKEKAGSSNSFIDESHERNSQKSTSNYHIFRSDFHPNLRRSSARLSTNLRLLGAGERKSCQCCEIILHFY